jgi:hypothetical protein
MESIRIRARAHLPSVLLTLLSIVQAIALESLWDHTVHRQEIYELSLAATTGWLQIAVSLFIIIMVWLAYVSLVMRFIWTPSVTDLTLPFFVGVIELLMIESMGPDELGAWFVVLALIFTLLLLLTHSLYRRARRDSDNAEFFQQIQAATWRDHLLNAAYVAVVALAGIGFWLYDYPGWVAVIALLVLLCSVAYQIRLLAGFWRTSMGEVLPTPATDSLASLHKSVAKQ